MSTKSNFKIPGPSEVWRLHTRTNFIQVDAFTLVRSWRTRREQVVRSAAQYEHLLQVVCARLEHCGANPDGNFDVSSGDDSAYVRLSRNILLIEVVSNGDCPHDRNLWTSKSAHEDILELACSTASISRYKC